MVYLWVSLILLKKEFEGKKELEGEMRGEVRNKDE